MFIHLIYRILFVAFVCCSSSAFGAMSETARLQSHLKLVEELLRLKPTDRLTLEQRKNREQGLNDLRMYWMTGIFPSNINRPDQRRPYFIDHLGVPCAAGFLIIQSGHRELAERISQQMNDAYLDQMEDPELENWIQKSGFTLDELRLIQPSYAYRAQYKDPFIEAAYLGDLTTVQNLFKAGLGPNSAEKINDALRAVAPVLDSEPPVETPPERTGIYYEPVPYKGQGLDVAKFLISKGANVNDRSQGRNSILFTAKTEAGRKFFSAQGGLLNQPELFLDAIDKDDIHQLQKYLKMDGFQIYRSDAIDTPLAKAFHRALKSGKSEFLVPLAQAKIASMKTIYLLLQNAPAKIRLNEVFSDNSISIDTKSSLINFALMYRMWNIAEELMKKGVTLNERDRSILLDQYLEQAHANIATPSPRESGSLEYFTPKVREVFENEIRKGVPYNQYQIKNLVERSVEYQDLRALTLLSQLHPKPEPQIGLWLVTRPPFSDPDIEKRLNLLVRMGADLNKSYGHLLPIQVAIERGDEKYIRLLIQNGALINPPVDRIICPPLAIAIAQNNVKRVKQLLKLGADPDHQYNAEISDCSKENTMPTFVPGKGYLLRPEKISRMPMSPEMKQLISKK